MHGFNDGETEAFGDRGEEKCSAVGVEPSALGVGDDTDDMDARVGGCESAEVGGIFCSVVASNDKLVIGEVLHQREERMNVFLFFDFTEGKEEGHVGLRYQRGLLLRSDGEVFDGVVDDAGGFAAEVDDAGGVVLCEAGDEGEFRGAVAHAL